MRTDKYLLILLIGFPQLGCPARPQPPALPELIDTSGSYTHADSGMTFPQMVNDFRRAAVRRYDSKGLDVSAGYDLYDPPRRVSVTVYVYPSLPLVSVGSSPEVVETARATLSNGQFDAQKRGIVQLHPGARLVGETEVSLLQGGRTYRGRAATFEYEDVLASQRQPLRSQLYLFTYIGGGRWAIKYRFTHPENFDASKEIEAFMQGLAWTVKEE